MCTPHPVSERTTSGSAKPTGSPWSCRSTTRCRFTAEITDFAGQKRVRRQPGGHPLAEGTRPRAAPRDLRPQLSALLAHRHADHLPGHQLVVREGQPTSPTTCWPPTTRSTGSPPMFATGSSASGWRGPGTGRSAENRFWGAPIPIWRSDDPAYPRIDVYGSLDEIEADFGVRPDDLHRPFIDELVRPNPDDPTGRSMMRRVPEVLDCWFESGSNALRPASTTRSRTSSDSRITIRPTSSSSTSPRPEAGSTPCTCCRWRCSASRRSPT